MARNRNFSSGGKKKGTPSVSFTRSADQRSVGNSIFLRLDDDGKFTGYALFNPDPASDDNDGYVEYGEHWDQQGTRFVPCWGAKNGCIFCKAGQSPSQRALSAFLVTSIDGDELDEPEIKLFRMNWTMIQEWGDTLDEDGETLGQKVRIKCISRRDGDFTTKFYDGKADRLAKVELKAALKDMPDIEEQIQRSLDRALEGMRVSNVLENDDDEDVNEDTTDDADDDEDEDEEEKPKRGRPKGSKNKKKDDDEEDEEDDDDEAEGEDEDDEDDVEEEVEEEEEVKPKRGRPKGSKNKKKEEVEEEDDDEDDEDEDDEEDEEKSDDDDDDDEEVETTTGTLTIKEVNEGEGTFTVKELKSDLYLNADLAEDFDFDEFKKGDKIEVEYGQDEDEDFVAVTIKKAKGKKK